MEAYRVKTLVRAGLVVRVLLSIPQARRTLVLLTLTAELVAVVPPVVIVTVMGELVMSLML